MSDSTLLHVTEDTFDEEVLQADGPVLVDFWASWCQPCLKMAPVLEELAEEFAGQVKIVKLDIDANPAAAMRFGVISIPTLNLYRDGDVAHSIVGARPKPALVAELTTALA